MKRILPSIAALLAGAAPAAVPMTPAGNGHLVVPTFVNGKGTVPFVLDTGADATAVYDWFARQQALPLGEAVSVQGQTGATDAPTHRVDSLAIDGRTIRDVAASGLPDRKDGAITAGIAGNDLMDGAVATFDFPCAMLTLTPKPAAMSGLLTKAATLVEGGTVAHGTQLTLPVEVNGVRGTAVLDSGSRSTQVNAAFARAAGMTAAGAGETLYGAAGKALATQEGRAASIRFAGREVRDATVRIADLPVFATFGLADRPAMILGQNVMAGFRLVYDHQAKRFWFDRSRCLPR